MAKRKRKRRKAQSRISRPRGVGRGEPPIFDAGGGMGPAEAMVALAQPLLDLIQDDNPEAIERALALAALAWSADNWPPEERDKLLADCAQAGKIPAEDMDTFYEIIEMLIQRKHELGIR